MAKATIELDLNELRTLVSVLQKDPETHDTPLSDKIRLAFFDFDNFLSVAGLPPYRHPQVRLVKGKDGDFDFAPPCRARRSRARRA